MSTINIEGLRVSYGAVDVLKDLSLSVAEGEFVVLLGASGCGKSTLLNAIAGLTQTSDGVIEIGGKDVTFAEPNKRGIAMVFQSYALYPKMTVRGNLAFSLRVAGLKKDEINRRVNEAARFLQITDLLDRRPVQLSGGQRQRVAIGRALVREVDVFLFDEPLSNLDAKLRTELRIEIKRLHRDLGNTMIYVTHDQVEALTLADRIAVMKDGIIQQMGTPDEIYDRPQNLFVASFIGSPAINLIEGTVEEAGGQRVFRSAHGELPLPEGTAVSGLEPGHPVTAGIRPENLRPAVDGEAVFAESAIDIAENMGSETIVWTESAERTFSVRIAGKPRLSRGQSLPLATDPEQVSFFDRKSGNRV